MVNTRTDADLSVAVQNALQTLLPQIRAEIHKEFRTSSGPSDAGRRVVIDISRPLSRVVTGTTVIITTVMDQTGEKDCKKNTTASTSG
nr:hypothetical protein [Tanacetum cinerariifolium]